MPTATPPVPARHPAVAALDAFITQSKVDTSKSGWRTSLGGATKAKPTIDKAAIVVK